MTDIWDWIGRYHEHIKIGFAVAAAAWVLIEFKGKESENRVAQTIEYVKQSSTGELSAAEIKITRYWLREDTVQKLKSIPKGDKEAWAAFVIKSVDDPLFAEVWKVTNFYKGLAMCVNSGICDSKTACERFHRDIRVFVNVYAPYFERYSETFGDDILGVIRQMLANQDCKASHQ
jgi:hypothetical protein